uniref:Uncharacterized protein n=1 Tax=Nymphaea colorata TaxID=210225 RepID=A0A5K1DMN4_9MAGN
MIPSRRKELTLTGEMNGLLDYMEMV